MRRPWPQGGTARPAPVPSAPRGGAVTGETAADITRNDEYGTFTRLLLDWAQALPDTAAHVFVRDTGTATAAEHLTYGELDRAARTLAVRLRERGAQGRPVLLLHPPGPDFLKAFPGCLYAGAIAVPAPLPGDRAQRLRALTGIIRDAGARAVLTDSAHAPARRCGWRTAGLERPRLPGPTSTRTPPADDWRPPRLAPRPRPSCSTPPAPRATPRASWSPTATCSPTSEVIARASSARRRRPVRRLAAALPRHGPHRSAAAPALARRHRPC